MCRDAPSIYLSFPPSPHSLYLSPLFLSTRALLPGAIYHKAYSLRMGKGHALVSGAAGGRSMQRRSCFRC